MMRSDRRKYWEEQYAAYQESGQTCREFCIERGISYASLKSWITKLRRVDNLKFIEMPALKSSEGMSIVLSSGMEIKVPDGFNEASLKRLLSVCGG